MTTRWARFQEWRRRHEPQVLAAFAAIFIALVIVGQLFPWVMDLLITRGIIALFSLLIVLDISNSLGEIARQANKVVVAWDQSEDTKLALARLADIDPLGRVDLLEYSALSVKPILQELNDRKATMRLLVKNPTTVGDHQAAEIQGSLKRLLNIELKDYENRLEVRCYRSNPSLRGRRYGDHSISVGWYTPDLDKPELEIRGHSNPVVTARIASEEGQRLNRMFTGVFERLWTKDSEPMAVALPKPAARPRGVSRRISKVGSRSRTTVVPKR